MSADVTTARFVRRLRDVILTVDRLVRLHQLFFTAIWPLLGAATVRGDLSTAELAGLLGVAICFLVPAAVINDVVDLPIDRTDPNRQQDLLVRGIVEPRQAVAIAVVSAVLTIPLTAWVGGAIPGQLMLGAAFVLMVVYNVWGKRCPVPPLTDLVQGLSWASFTLYGPLAIGGAPNALTWTLAAYAVVLTLSFNGVHGSLRDLTNDLMRGARTTAIFLGARPDPEQGVARVPAAMAVYASLVLAAVVAVSTIFVIRNDFGYEPLPWTVMAIGVSAVNLAAVALQPHMVRPRPSTWDASWRLQLYLVTVNPILAFIGYAGANVTLLLAVLHFIALMLFGCTGAILRWMWWLVRSASPARRIVRIS
jgi:4-hydroxybenzoate polyprenyltransferase